MTNWKFSKCLVYVGVKKIEKNSTRCRLFRGDQCKEAIANNVTYNKIKWDISETILSEWLIVGVKWNSNHLRHALLEFCSNSGTENTSIIEDETILKPLKTVTLLCQVFGNFVRKSNGLHFYQPFFSPAVLWIDFQYIECFRITCNFYIVFKMF